MTAEQFLKESRNFEGTAYFAFDLGYRVLAIGRIADDGPIQLYERDRRSEEQGGTRTPLATFEGEDEAARAGAFFASMGEMIR